MDLKATQNEDLIQESAGYDTLFRKPSTLNAFTLAEVLITLGIIGVVAAFTMPTLVNKTQTKVLETQYKKAISVLNNGYKKMLADNEVFKVNELPLTTCNDISCVSSEHKKVVNMVSDSSNNEFDTDITYKNVNDAELDFNWDDVPYKFITPDGVMYGLTSMSTRNNETEIGFCFDINGEKAPNQVGKDFHQVVINDNGSITPITPAPEDFDDLADMVNQCESQNGEWDYTTGSCQQRRPGQTY